MPMSGEGRDLERWRGTLTDDEIAILRSAGDRERIPLEGRIAILIIDVTYDTTGDEGDEHLVSIAKFRSSCGPYAWRAVPAIAALLSAARHAALPIIFTRGSRTANPLKGHDWSRTRASRTLRGRTEESLRRGSEFPVVIAPLPSELIIEKPKASAFWATPLDAHLIDLGIDHIVIAGCTTSGCVRATATDANNRNYGVTVVEEAVFDRTQTSHRVNLFDIDRKLGNVMPLEDVIRVISRK